MRILAISGSLRAGSVNAGLLRARAEEVPAEVEVEHFDRLRAIPPYDEDTEADGQGVEELLALRAALDAADAVVFATPEYNGSIPGQLKNVLDWISRPIATNELRNKPVAVISASNGQFGAVWAAEDLKKVLKILGARVLKDSVAVPLAHTQFTAEGRFGNANVRTQLRSLVESLAGEVEITEGAARMAG